MRARPPSPATATPVLEWAPFRLAAGKSEEHLLLASAALQRDFLSLQPGFLGRELLRGPGDGWVDLVRWRSRADVERAMQAAAESPVCFTYFRMMAGDVSAGSDVRILNCVLPQPAPGVGASGDSSAAAVVEWRPFRLAPEGGEEDLRVDAASQEERYSREAGFVGRELLRGEAGAWVELVWWAGREDRDRARERLGYVRAAPGAAPAGGAGVFGRVATYL